MVISLIIFYIIFNNFIKISGYASQPIWPSPCQPGLAQDLIPPSITISSPNNNDKLFTSSIIILGTAYDNRCYDSGVKDITVKVGNEFYNVTLSESWGVEINLNPGKNVIQATATDNFNNINTTSITLLYDSKPSVILASPLNKQSFYLNNEIPFICSLSDDFGLSKVELWLKEPGKDWNINETRLLTGLNSNEVFMKSFNLEGSYSWNCKVYDDSGNYDWGYILFNNQQLSASFSVKKCDSAVCNINNIIPQPECTSECNLGETKCSKDGYLICQKYSFISKDKKEQICNKWNPNINQCPLNTICNNGQCILPFVTCTSECNLGERRCNANGYQICLQNQNGCSEWGEVKICLQNQECSQGYCSNLKNKCIDGTSIKECSNNKPKYCSDGILKDDCSICGCNNNGICLEDGTCISRLEYKKVDDPRLLENVPKIRYVPEIKKQVVNENAKKHPPIADAGHDLNVNIKSTFILDGSKSFDQDNDLSEDGFSWYENGALLGNGKTLKLDYNEGGLHKINLIVKDNAGLSSEDEIFVNVIDKNKCKDTNARYFPQDTICNSKWPSEDGKIILINSKEYSCNLVEVCDESLDYVIDDALDCCDGSPLKDTKKANSCGFANKYSDENSKKCQALYLIKSFGADQVYIQDYFEAEMCCRGVEDLCSNKDNLYKAKPIPNTNNTLNLKCSNSPSNNPPGEWIYDTRIEKNNIALFDAPAHATLNKLKTGTCVDYSFALTTLLRKDSYSQYEVLSVEAPNHAYNLIKFPLDKKYTIVDTTGNKDPPLVFGSVPYGYDYCENIKNCYNDNGKAICPKLKDINGCENAKETFLQESRFKGEEIKSRILEFIKDFIKEISL